MQFEEFVTRQEGPVLLNSDEYGLRYRRHALLSFASDPGGLFGEIFFGDGVTGATAAIGRAHHRAVPLFNGNGQGRRVGGDGPATGSL